MATRTASRRPGILTLLRLGTGWFCVFGVLAALSQHAETLLPGLPANVRDAASGGALAALATALGALPIVLMRRITISAESGLLGFGAGVMLAASFFSLILPGFEIALERHAALGAIALMATGIIAGAGLLLLLDSALPHTHHPGYERNVAAVWLFVFAIAVHNIPEGLAIGVAAGEAGSGDAVATGIALRNVPEGLIIAAALVAAGYTRHFAFAIAALSGLVEPIAAILGAALVSIAASLLPWGLAAAAGAMLFVVSHEIIPESHRRGHETLATTGLLVGFVVMMTLDTPL